MCPARKVAIKLGQAKMRATLKMTFVKNDNQNKTKVHEKIEEIILDNQITSGRPIRANGFDMTSNVVGVRFIKEKKFEIETNIGFYDIEFLN